MGTSEPIAPLLDTTVTSPEWVWTFVVTGLWLVVVGIAKKISKDSETTIFLAIYLAIPLLILISIIWWLDTIRWIVAIILALLMMGFVLALWRVSRSGLWQGWLTAVVIVTTIFVVSTVPLWPIESTEFLWFILPLGVPVIVASFIGFFVRRHRCIAKLEQEQVAREKEKEVAAALRVKEIARLRAEVRRRDIEAAELQAKKTAQEQDVQAGKAKPKRQISRTYRVLQKLWYRVQGKVGQGVSLEHLAELVSLSVEQTYVAVCMLEEWMAVTIDRRPDRTKWTDLTIYLDKKGANIVLERRGAIVKNKKIKVGKRANVGHLGKQSGGTTSIGVVGDKNNVDRNEVVANSHEDSLKAILEAVQNLRVQLTEPYQIHTLDAQVEELKTAKDESTRRSALEGLKIVASTLGPIATPVLDIVNNFIEMMNSTT